MATMDPGQRGFGRPMRRQGPAGGRAQGRNPESVLDRGFIEQLLAGEMLNTSATGGTRIRTREDAAASEQRSAEAGKIALMVLAMLVGGGGAQRGAFGTMPLPKPGPGFRENAYLSHMEHSPFRTGFGNPTGGFLPNSAFLPKSAIPTSRAWLGPAAAAGGIQAARQDGASQPRPPTRRPPSGRPPMGRPPMGGPQRGGQRPPMGGGRPPVVRMEDLVRALSGRGGGASQADLPVPQARR